MRSPALSGIFVPTLAAVDADGRLNEPEQRRLFDWLLARGVAGLYPNGSTGEFLRLPPATQDRILELAVAAASEADGDPLILAGAYGATVPLALERCRAAADRGARAAAVVAPFYYRVGDDAVRGFYRELAAASPIDLMLYNIPLFASPISAGVVAELAVECPRIIGIKDSSGDAAHMQRMLSRVRPQRPDFAFLTGWDNVLTSMLLLGCDGGTHAAANVVPEVLVAIFDAVRGGDLHTARRLQAPLADLFDTLIGSNVSDGPEFPDGFRIGTAARGFAVEPGLLPRGEADQRRLAALSSRVPELLAAFGDLVTASPST